MLQIWFDFEVAAEPWVSLAAPCGKEVALLVCRDVGRKRYVLGTR